MCTRVVFWNVRNVTAESMTTQPEYAALLLIDRNEYDEFLTRTHDHALGPANHVSDAHVVTWLATIAGKDAADITSARQASQILDQAISNAPAVLKQLGSYEERLRLLIWTVREHELMSPKMRKDFPNEGILGRDRRRWVVDTVCSVPWPELGATECEPPDLVLIVEPMVRRGEALAQYQAQLPTPPTATATPLAALDPTSGAFTGFWVGQQLLADLAERDPDGDWNCITTSICSNNADIQGGSIVGTTPFFELYTLLYRGGSAIEVTPVGFLAGHDERSPYEARVGTKHGDFLLTFTHAVFGKPQQRVQTVRDLAAHFQGTSAHEPRRLVIGDFNLDARSHQAEFDAFQMTRVLPVDAKTSLTTKWPRASKPWQVNAYDQIFFHSTTTGNAPVGGIHDFVQLFGRPFWDHYASDSEMPSSPFSAIGPDRSGLSAGLKTRSDFYEEIYRVSDHLPVWCRVCHSPPGATVAPLNRRIVHVRPKRPSLGNLRHLCQSCVVHS